MKNNYYNKFNILNVYSKKSIKSKLATQILYGEKFKILSKNSKWFKIKLYNDNYKGFILKKKFNQKFNPTHKIFNLKAKIYKYPNPSIVLKNKIVHGYGASTKGNVLLQYFNINQNYMKFIADRNPKKYNCYTPGSKIKIISEKESRKLLPDYYFVLPWHFKKEILKREIKIRKKGWKFIFPLPNLKIY